MSWYKTVLAVLIALGILAGLPDLAGRIRLERADHRVELVADQDSFLAMAEATGTPFVPFLQQLKAAGVKGLGVSEATLSSLDVAGQLTVASGANWLDALRQAGQPAPTVIQPVDTYVLFPPGSALPLFVQRGLAQFVSGVRQLSVGGRTVIQVPLPPGTVISLPLGFMPGAFSYAEKVGMDIVPRPSAAPIPYRSTAAVANLVKQMGAATPVHAVLFAGASQWALPAAPASLADWAAAFTHNHWNLGLLETPQQLSNVDQPGTKTLSGLVDQRAVRVYSVPTWMLQNYTTQQTVLAIVGSVLGRNLRLVYVHPYTTGPNEAARTVQLYRQTASRLQARGFQLAPPTPIGTLTVPTYQRVLQALAAVAAGLMLLGLLWPPLWRLGVWPLVVVGGLALLLALGSHTLSRELTALGAAVAMGGLAVYFVADTWNRWAEEKVRALPAIWVRGLVVAVVAALITFCGALIVASVLGDTVHMIEWQYFRGVKVTYLGVPLVGLLAFLAAVGLGRRRERPEGMLSELAWLRNQPLTYGHVAVMLLLAAIFGYYLLRSGNVSSSLVLPLEMHMRLWLQSHLPVRPREKDFLVGYPSLFLAVYCAMRRWRWPFLLFLLGAAVGQVSIVDTFEHIRTPLLYSVMREGLGMAVGVITGTLALVVVWAVVRLWETRRRRTAVG